MEMTAPDMRSPRHYLLRTGRTLVGRWILQRLLGALVLTLFAGGMWAAELPASDGSSSQCITLDNGADARTSIEREHRQYQLFREHQGKIIRAIDYQNFNIFDETNEEENNRLYLFLNKLHIHTLEDVIASQLLFRVGDPLNPGEIAESERLLRSRNYLANAYITLTEACANSVSLKIHTQDSWTTEPQVSFGHSGGETSSGFALSEGNFLGSGNSVAVGYRKDANRSGILYSFSSPHFLNSRLAASIGYSDNSDGEDSVVNITYPFFSLNTPTSFGLKSEKLTQVELIRSRGETIDEYQHKIERHEVFFGKGINLGDFTHRLLIGISDERDGFEQNEDTVGALPTDRELTYPWLEYQFIEDEFSVYRNIHQIQRVEDLAMGKSLTLRVGYAGEAFDNADDAFRFSGEYTDVLAVNDHHIFKFSAHVDGRQYSSLANMSSTVAGGEFAYHLLQSRNHRWYARLRYDAGKDLQRHEKLTVGGMVGVRGYPLDFQRGDQRYVFSLEKRYFSDIHLFNLFRIGGVAFFDAGRAWDSENADDASHLSNVGVGLRVSSSKARIGHIVHIDVAFPTAEKGDADTVQWLIQAEQVF